MAMATVMNWIQSVPIWVWAITWPLWGTVLVVVCFFAITGAACFVCSPLIIFCQLIRLDEDKLKHMNEDEIL